VIEGYVFNRENVFTSGLRKRIFSVMAVSRESNSKVTHVSGCFRGLWDVGE
jgi:hypothetical protein